ncbi:competence protein ComK [Natronobacillus azotifigens]|uniref:competence protein ComK n=1 Tax=Natronobacillus azotifigens TaxID=472978 RepID=UPI003AF03EC9
MKQRPLSIIKDGCIIGGSTYEGRVIAMQHLLHIRQKLPVPISPHRQICAFPTESPRNFDCHWIFPSHIQEVKKEQEGVTLVFSHAHLHVNLSVHTVNRQLTITNRCQMLLSNNVNYFITQRK